MAATKGKKLFVLASALLLLAACDVDVRPSYGDDDYLLNGETTYESDTKVEDLTNNLRTLVYDKLLDNGNINSDVLDQAIYLLAEKEIGNYDDLLKATDEESKNVVAEINERMDDKLYDEVSSGSYETNNKFDERTFIKRIQQSLTYKITDNSGNVCSSYTSDYVFLKDSRDHLYAGGAYADGEDYTIDNREPNNGKYVLSCNYSKYKEEKYLETVYRELLVEKYIKTEELDSLGRSAGRKIKYVAIARNDNHPQAAEDLVSTFVENYIKEGAVADLSVLEQAWKGIDLPEESNPEDPQNAVNILLMESGIKTADHDYTRYGDILTRYNKIQDNLLLNDKTIEDEFTGNGAYVKEKGLEMQENSLRKEKISDDGWFAKSNDASSLPAAISDRLFEVAVANNVHNNLKGENEDTNNKYVKKVNGVYYLKPTSIESPDVVEKNMDCVIYDKTSSTYYIVQIEEAVNSTKLRTSENTVNQQYTDEMRAEVVDEMAKKFAERDTYEEKALVYYLENADIAFHDTDVYEYFKETYSDIWGEDAD